jgi:hypothetical protein
MSTAQIVSVCRVDIENELRKRLLAGQQTVRIGLGGDVDIGLLDDDLLVADVLPSNRQLVILTVHCELGFGYVLSRGFGNFGVYFTEGHNDFWASLRRSQTAAGLRPGDKVGLGSCPAETIRFRLPYVQGLPDPREGVEGYRTEHVLSERFRVALEHWDYATVTFGGHERAVVQLEERALHDLRAALVRKIDAPEEGLRLMVLSPTPKVELRRPDAKSWEVVAPGRPARLEGAGNRLRVAMHEWLLPPPVRPTPRFSGRERPSRREMAEIFGLELADLQDPALMKARYRELVRRFHPDRHPGSAGHTSRFLEVSAVWDCYQDKGASNE